MSKLKTHSGAKKRFSITGTGKVKHSRAFMQHNLRRRPKDMKSKSLGVMMSDRDAPRVLRQLLPNGL
jgi:large subunit ribosomal protein L35